MNTLEIWNALKFNKYTRKHFKGVFPIDKIPKIIGKRPSLIVVNTDKSDESGTHWLAIYLSSKDKGEFFDSYGRKPTQKEILNFFKRNHIKSVFYNKTQLQGYLSEVCGQYCCVYLLSKAKNWTLKRFLKLFHQNENAHENDKLVYEMFLNNFSMKHSDMKKKIKPNHVQTCRACRLI